MSTLSTRAAEYKPDFALIAAPFLNHAGLPFAQVLDAATIASAFDAEGALFAQEDVFSTAVVLWAFLAQVLRDGKGSSCTAAVNDITAFLLQTGHQPPSSDTGVYCRARAKLNVAVLHRLVVASAKELESACEPAWLWRGRHAKLVDGFTFTMPDTPENRAAFPQNPSQIAGVGLPIARACAVVSLATRCVCDLAIGPYAGKETGESALLRTLLGAFSAGDVAVFDRGFCSYWVIATLARRGVDVCARLNQCRLSDFRSGEHLGPDDHLVTWPRPKRPAWMSEEDYMLIPETLTLREARFPVNEPQSRAKVITVVTTLANPAACPCTAVAALYQRRWDVELDIRSLKQPLRLDHLRCKTPHMVQRELWVTMLAYNLIRKVMAIAAAQHAKHPRQLSFTATCQTILGWWVLWSTGAVRDPALMRDQMLAQIASHTVGDRPGRVEPRVLKRRRHRYPLMQQPRAKLRARLMQGKS